MLIIFYVIMSYLRMNVFEKEEWEVRMRRQRRMNFIEIGCSALKYTVSIDAYIMDSKTNKQIVFALMIFCIASMITASITSNTNNNINNNNLLAFAKKKKGGSAGGSTSSSASSSSSSSTDSPTHTVKKVKTKKPNSSGSSTTTPSDTTVKKIKKPKKPKLDTSTGGGGSPGGTPTTLGTTGTTGSGGSPGGPGGNGDNGGTGGPGGPPVSIGNPPPPTNPPPKICNPPKELINGKCKTPVVKPPACEPPMKIINGNCETPVTNPPPPLTCKDGEVLKDGVCVPKPVDCTLTPGIPECQKPDCTKTPNDPKCVPDCTKNPTDPKCPHRCPDGSTYSNGACHCPPGEHFNSGKTKCLVNNHPTGGISQTTINIKVINTVVIRQSFRSGVPNTVVHSFTEFTNNPTHSKVVIILPTKNVQDAATKDMNIFGTIFNTGSGTARNIGQVRATIFDKDNNTLATLTAIPAAQDLRTQSTTTYQLVIPHDQVKLNDIRYIEFELVPLRTGSASVASSSSS
jgi:hypothetical protein